MDLWGFLPDDMLGRLLSLAAELANELFGLS